jgi:predicted DNA-binding ribbon-helix-helix protein
MPPATTIKVSRELRERIKTGAASRGITTAALIAELLDRYEYEARMSSVARAYASDVDADYVREFRVWADATAQDGIDE